LSQELQRPDDEATAYAQLVQVSDRLGPENSLTCIAQLWRAVMPFEQLINESS
jgi:hypothetical protein